MLEEVTKDFPNVKIIPFEGLLVEFAKQMDAKVIVRGLRAITDFEYELQMSQTNHKIEPEIETLFLTTSLEFDNGKRSCELWGGHYTVCTGSDCEKNKREDGRKKRSVNYEQSY